MASFSLSNLLSFILPSKPSPPPPPPASMPPLHTTSRVQKPSDASLSMSVQEERERRFDSSSSLSTELAAVICPSLAYSNTLFYSSGYNVQVIVDENESEERLLNRFRREVMKAGVIQEVKRRRYFENAQDEKKRRTREAAKRNRRRRNYSRFSPRDKPEEIPKKKDDEEDNWEWPEGENVPF